MQFRSRWILSLILGFCFFACEIEQPSQSDSSSFQIEQAEQHESISFPNYNDTKIPPRPPANAPLAKISAAQTISALTTLDLMVLYTSAAVTGAGGETNLKSKIDQAVAFANQAFINGGVNAEYRLVYKGSVGTYTEASTYNANLDNITAGINTSATLRNQYKADMVAFIINGGESNMAGLAWQLQTDFLANNWFEPYAFCVVNQNYLTDAHKDGASYNDIHTLSHELGHLLGAGHNEINGGSAPCHSFMRGIYNTSNFDIMTYWTSTTTLVDYFSKNGQIINGKALGNSSHDIVRGFNGDATYQSTIAVAAAWRQASTSNKIPNVTLTSPANGASYIAPASIAFAATASDSDGTITKVEFYQGTTKVGEDLTSPYSYNWTGVAAGSYTLMAKTTDNLGATRTSASVTVTVSSSGGSTTTRLEAELAAMVGSAIANESSASAGKYVDMNASSKLTFSYSATSAGAASLNFRTCASTTSRKMGVYVNGAKIGILTTTTLRYSWGLQSFNVNLVSGANTIALQDTEGTAEPDVDYLEIVKGSASGNKIPIIALTAPSNGTNYTAPANIAFAATASDSDGTITKVEFFRGTTKVGEDLTAPYTYNWTGVAAGSYTLMAKATDNLGATRTSTSVNVTVSTSGGSTTTRLEAELAAMVASAITNESSASAAKYVDMNTNAKLTFSYSATSAGAATLKFRTCAGSLSRKMGVYVNGVKIGILTTTTLRYSWSLQSFNVNLVSGVNTIELQDTEGTAEPDVDYLEITK